MHIACQWRQLSNTRFAGIREVPVHFSREQGGLKERCITCCQQHPAARKSTGPCRVPVSASDCLFKLRNRSCMLGEPDFTRRVLLCDAVSTEEVIPDARNASGL